ncbi:hypothetical protein BAUCODRAFT_38264 [Baudoinia panamericana UAMH 10762]|uniref:Peptidase A1 domain-containing protein n=1 Tax=Baudoinia panamericana (strain UAMH 10762) TaxID=717646 RepID=M2N0S9_BAUPA|nr:uncharacterized protein BAUCODRAFT_38264 [Baudoinia panamericana UAMH 10762]EMC92240.1 hypothetical protein BAUCODRAFT_38264 [Baudoinia panamericana UAMH 10762]
MSPFISAIAFAATATIAMAAPADIYRRDTFQIEQVSTGQVLKSGPIAMMKTYSKYAKVGASAPVDVVNAATNASQSGEVAANPEQYDESYLCPVQVGQTTLNLDFDTGSADLWVFSTLTPKSESTGHSLYNPSTGTKKSGYTWDISYGDGSGASGTVYADKVVVGGVTATSQAVEAATSVSSQFEQDTDNDGLLGLAFSSINTVEPQAQKTFFDSVKGSLAKPLFTADLKKGAAGTYDFGYIDSSKYTGSISYVNVNTANGFWEFTASGYAVGSGSVSGSVGDAIADTGTTLMYLPTTVVQAYYNKVDSADYDSNQGGYTYDCSENLPNFLISLGGKTFTVSGTDINFAPVDSSGETCFGGIQENTGIGMSILGDIFLKSVFVVFDQTQSTPRLGFAAQ